MKIPCALALPLFVAASPVFAQAAPPPVAPAPGTAAKAFRLEAAIAPKWSYYDPLVDDGQADSTVASLTLTYSVPIPSSPVNVSFTAGPSFVLDMDDNRAPGDPESGFTVGTSVSAPVTDVKLPWVEQIKLFASAKQGWSFPGILEGNSSRKLNLEGGLTIGRKFGNSDNKERPTLEGTAALGMVHSSNPLGEHSYRQAKMAFSTPLWWFAAFDVEASGTQRRFEEVDPEHGVKQRREELGAAVGLDIARFIRAVTKADKDYPWIRKAKVGVAFTKEDSNIDSKDKTDTSPSLNFAMGWYF